MIGRWQSSWSIYKNSCLQNLKLRILILNKCNNPSGGSFSSRSLFAFQNALPWIQGYRVVGSTKSEMVKEVVAIAEDLSWLRQALPPECRDMEMFVKERQALPPECRDMEMFVKDLLDPKRVLTTYPEAWLRQALPPECRDMEMFVKDLLDPKRVLTTYPEGDLERSRDMELTKNLWIQNLLKAGNRHSVANLVAPAILASGLPNSIQPKGSGADFARLSHASRPDFDSPRSRLS